MTAYRPPSNSPFDPFYGFQDWADDKPAVMDDQWAAILDALTHARPRASVNMQPGPSIDPNTPMGGVAEVVQMIKDYIGQATEEQLGIIESQLGILSDTLPEYALNDLTTTLNTARGISPATAEIPTFQAMPEESEGGDDWWDILDIGLEGAYDQAERGLYGMVGPGVGIYQNYPGSVITPSTRLPAPTAGPPKGVVDTVKDKISDILKETSGVGKTTVGIGLPIIPRTLPSTPVSPGFETSTTAPEDTQFPTIPEQEETIPEVQTAPVIPAGTTTPELKSPAEIMTGMVDAPEQSKATEFFEKSNPAVPTTQPTTVPPTVTSGAGPTVPTMDERQGVRDDQMRIMEETRQADQQRVMQEQEATRVESERVAEEQRLEQAGVERERVAEASRVESARVAQEEAARVESERVARVEQERVETDRLAGIERQRVEDERLVGVETARVESERLATEERARVETERLATEESARVESARLAQVERERVESARLAQEEADRVEEQQRVQAATDAQAESDRLETVRLEQEEAGRVETARLAQVESDRVEQERVAQVAEAQAKAEEEARIAAEQAETARQAGLDAEREKADRLAVQEAEKAETDRIHAEKEAQFDAEREAFKKAAEDRNKANQAQIAAQQEASQQAAQAAMDKWTEEQAARDATAESEAEEKRLSMEEMVAKAEESAARSAEKRAEREGFQTASEQRMADQEAKNKAKVEEIARKSEEARLAGEQRIAEIRAQVKAREDAAKPVDTTPADIEAVFDDGAQIGEINTDLIDTDVGFGLDDLADLVTGGDTLGDTTPPAATEPGPSSGEASDATGADTGTGDATGDTQGGGQDGQGTEDLDPNQEEETMPEWLDFVTNIGGALLTKDAADKSAKAIGDASEAGIGLQRDMFGKLQERIDPFWDMGVRAINPLDPLARKSGVPEGLKDVMGGQRGVPTTSQPGQLPDILSKMLNMSPNAPSYDPNRLAGGLPGLPGYTDPRGGGAPNVPGQGGLPGLNPSSFRGLDDPRGTFQATQGTINPFDFGGDAYKGLTEQIADPIRNMMAARGKLGAGGTQDIIGKAVTEAMMNRMGDIEGINRSMTQRGLSEQGAEFGQGMDLFNTMFGADLARGQAEFGQASQARGQEFGERSTGFGQEMDVFNELFGQGRTAGLDRFGQASQARGQEFGERQADLGSQMSLANMLFGQGRDVQGTQFGQSMDARRLLEGERMSQDALEFGQSMDFNQQLYNQLFGQRGQLFGEGMSEQQQLYNQLFGLMNTGANVGIGMGAPMASMANSMTNLMGGNASAQAMIGQARNKGYQNYLPGLMDNIGNLFSSGSAGPQPPAGYNPTY